MTTLLVVDDDEGVRDVVGAALKSAGYQWRGASDGVSALAAWREERFDAIVLDINLPGRDGFSVLDTIRQSHDDVPVLLLSARDADQDVVRGLQGGADDYVRKPFGLDELLARVAAILRRGAGTSAAPRRYDCGPLTLDVDTHEVRLDGEPCDLSATEFRLLEALMRRGDRLATRDQLLSEVWDINFESETTVVDTYISYLRRKLHREGFAPITTVRGVGFKLVTPPS